MEILLCAFKTTLIPDITLIMKIVGIVENSQTILVFYENYIRHWIYTRCVTWVQKLIKWLWWHLTSEIMWCSQPDSHIRKLHTEKNTFHVRLFMSTQSLWFGFCPLSTFTIYHIPPLTQRLKEMLNCKRKFEMFRFSIDFPYCYIYWCQKITLYHSLVYHCWYIFAQNTSLSWDNELLSNELPRKQNIFS